LHAGSLHAELAPRLADEEWPSSDAVDCDAG
jgi:hypothetical protein